MTKDSRLPAAQRKVKQLSAIGLRTPALTKFTPLEIKGQDVSKIEPRERILLIDYTNWRNERRVREVKPVEIEFGRNKWHPTNQWLLHAKDMEDGKVKTFAMCSIHAMIPKVR